MFDNKSINIHYKAPTSRLLKMNTLNEFELNRIKKFYAQELANRLQRSKSTRLAGAQPNTCYWQTSGGAAAAAATTTLRRDQSLAPQLEGQLRAAAADGELDGGGTNVVDLKRYQHALSSKPRGRKQKAQQQQQQHSCSPRFGRALYNFQAKNEGELSLMCGDLVELLDVLEGANWARVEDCQSGLQGLVPVSYLDLNIGCAVAKRDVGSSSSRSSSRLSQLEPEIATTAASLAADQLLPMSKGEPIALIRKLSGHLYEASNTRLATGLVWSNDLEIIKQPGGGGGADTCQCKTGTASRKSSAMRASGEAQFRRSANYKQRAAAGAAETLMVTDNIGGIDDDVGQGRVDSDDQIHQEDGEHDLGNDVGDVDDIDDDDDDDDDEIDRYLNQLQSICTDLGGSKRRQHQQHRQLVALDREVPLLLDSSLAKRRRARSASAALDLLHQEQRHMHQQHSQQPQQHPRHQHHLPQDRHQYLDSKQQQQQQQRHYAHQLDGTPTKRHEPMVGYESHPSRHQQFYSSAKATTTASTSVEQQNRSHKYCVCCKQQESEDLHHQRQPPRSSSSPHIVGATERLQQQQQQQLQATELKSATGAPPVSNSNLPRLCRARYAYKPRQRDELELVVGDILVVVQECDDGWFIGSSYTTKQMGTFPGNFVESI